MISAFGRAIMSTMQDVHDSFAFRRHSGSLRFKGVYSSFDAAMAALPPGGVQGFDHQSVAEYFVQTHIVFNPSDYAVLFWLSRLLKPGQLIFDFGGGIGQSFYVYQGFLRLPEGARWLVCDVKALADRGKQLAEDKQAKGLEFTTDLDCAARAAILLTTGTLQCVEADLPSLLATLPKLPENVLVNRVPMYEGETYYTIQHAHHSFVPYKVMNLASFIADMEKLGYRKVDQWYLPRSLRVPFHPAHFVQFYYGFYFQLYRPHSL